MKKFFYLLGLKNNEKDTCNPLSWCIVEKISCLGSASHTGFDKGFFLISFCPALFLCQNVPPAILLRFLREHRSEWADNNIDVYSAAAIKVGPCSLPGSRVGSFGNQVILPLAHTIEHEEVKNLTFTSISNF